MSDRTFDRPLRTDPVGAGRIRERMVRFSGVVGMVIPLVVALVDLLRGDVDGWLWKLTFSGGVGAAWLLYLALRNDALYASALNALLLAHLAMVEGGELLRGHRWLYLMPPFTFFVSGLRAGSWISGVAYLLTAALLVVRAPPQQSHLTAEILISVLLVYAFCWFYEYVRSRYEAELQQAAVTDQLTGLWNRRHFERALSDHLHLATRHRLPLTLVLFDVDRFKRINDELGHPTGDEVLRRIAEAIAPTLRASDVLARLGGDEFAIVAPGTATEDGDETSGGVVLARRVLDAVAAIPFDFDLPVRISAGVTQLREGDTLESLYQRADAALYAAKQQGRNQVVQAG